MGVIIIFGLFTLGIAATWMFHRTGWDLSWAARCYTPGGNLEGWTHSRDKLWALLYRYGEIPTVVLTTVAAVLLVTAKLGAANEAYTRPCLVVILTVVLGPAIVVNSILKPGWGRPRPVEVSNLGGDREYRAVWQPGGPGAGKSFPCGHCAMAYSLASGVAFYPAHPVVSACILVGVMAYGTLLGVARVMQGGHFPTDVLWSEILILMIVATLYFLVLRIPESV